MGLVGRTLAHYRVVAPLGTGGMGEVYRASDSKLGRDVALKVLPDHFAHDAERLARFEREAHLLAALNHANIAAIYGLEEADGVRFLVLEHVPGETLAERIAGRSLPIDEALGIARAIAEGVESAHEKGIIHRDLKPANVKITPDGTVKVLDFGLAKVFSDDPISSDLTRSPTITSDGTRAGVVLGTAAYMSPEQARGRSLDRRTDIWSFGSVLYEMLTGRQAFLGETVSDTIAAILRGEPDWSALPAETPPRLRELLSRCLEKDPKRRLRDIGDARLEIERIASGDAGAFAAGPALPIPAHPDGRRAALPWALAAAMTLLAVASLLWGSRRGPAPSDLPRSTSIFSIDVPPSSPLAIRDRPAIAISPDGTRLAYVAGRDFGGTLLYLREMDRLEPTLLAATEGASGPFFSPDGEWIGFFADGKLKKVSVRGGSPQTLCEAPDSRGACWGPDDAILFEPHFVGGLSRVPAAGGTPEVVTTPDSANDERTHRWPEILPQGDVVLFTVGSFASTENYDDARIAAHSLKTGKTKFLPLRGACTRYSPTGHIVFVRAGVLYAAPFDAGRLEVLRPAVPILENVKTDPATGSGNFAFSRSGTLAYIPGPLEDPERSLVWVDRQGNVEPITDAGRPFMAPKLSPNGKEIAVTIREGGVDDIWLYSLDRGTLSRLTFDSGSDPVWSPDGARVAYASVRGGPINMFWIAADGSGKEEQLTKSSFPNLPDCFTPDGRSLVYLEVTSAFRGELVVLPLDGDRVPTPLTKTLYDDWGGQISPDGRWIAYCGAPSAGDEVYVQAFPALGGKWQISTDGGAFPMWSRDGRELFYRDGDKMMVVPVTTGHTFVPGNPRLLFEKHFHFGQTLEHSYDVSLDGQRFLMVQEDERIAASTQINLVLGWSSELVKRVPRKKS